MGNKEFLFHVKISGKESKESRFWLRLPDLEENAEQELERAALITEATELMRIFGDIIRKRSE